MRIRSTKKPESIQTDENNVYVNSNITEREIHGMHIYIYDQKIYGKDEYIAMMSGELTNVQLALIGLYEDITGGETHG